MADPAGPAPIYGVTPIKPTLESQVETLAGFQRDTYYLLTSIIGADGSDETLGGMFEGLQDSLDSLAVSFSAGIPSSGFLEGSGAASSNTALGGRGSSFPSKPIKLQAKDRPTISDMLQLPVEFSMGYLLIYNKLDEMQKGKAVSSAKKAGPIDFFKGLAAGAAGIALLAIALVVFAGAMVLFQLVQWEPALAGMIAFSVFVLGMTAIAKIMGENMKDFKTFAVGVILLTIGILLFDVALAASAYIWRSGLLKDGLLAVGAYVAFIAGMAIAAKIVGSQLANFAMFAVGALILTAGILVFDFAIMMSASLLRTGQLQDGIVAVGVFMLFVLGMTAISLLVSGAIPAFLLFGVGVIILTVGLLLFGAAISVLSAMLPKIPAALVGIATLTALVVLIGALAAATIPLMVGLAIFSVAAILASTAFILWSAALGALSSAQEYASPAMNTLRESLPILLQIGAIATAAAILIPGLVLFSAALVLVSTAFVLWTVALGVLSLVSSERVAKAEIGIMASMNVLKSLKGMFIEIIAMGTFAVALSAFSLSMMTFAGVITRFGKLGDEEISQASKGISKVLAFLTDPRAGGVATLFESMDRDVMSGLSRFGKALKPFAGSMTDLGSSLKVFSDLGSGSVSAAAASIKILLGVFEELNNKLPANMYDSKASIFADDLANLGKGLKKLTDSASESVVSRIPSIASALEKLAAINLSSTFSPLLDLAKKQKDIERVATSLIKLTKALESPKTGDFTKFWQSLSSFNGGATASASAGAGEQINAAVQMKSPLEDYVKEIRDYMKTWETARQNQDMENESTPTINIPMSYAYGRGTGAIATPPYATSYKGN